MVHLGPSVVEPWFESMRLQVDIFLGAFLIHGEDTLLPFRVGAWDPKTNVCNDFGVVSGNPFADGLNKDASFGLVVKLSCQFGFSFHSSEEEVGGACHLDFPHLLFMDKFNGGIAELLSYHCRKSIPVGESIPRSPIVVHVFFFLFVVFVFQGIDVLIAKVDPPVLGFASE